MIFRDTAHIDPPYRDALAAGGLDKVGRVLDQLKGRVAAWSRTTITLHVPGHDGGPGFYLKRYRYPRWRHRVRGAFRGTFFGLHRGRAEFRLLNQMRTLGIAAVRPVSYGSRRRAHFVESCFLITEEVPDAVNLTTFAADVKNGRRWLPPAQRRRMARRLAERIAHMHNTGFSHGQLYWRNVLVRFGPQTEPEYFFLDARPRHGRRWLRRHRNWWLVELAQAAASALPFTTRTDRLRFMQAYYRTRQIDADAKVGLRYVEQLAHRWRSHETQRIRMNDRFETWNRRLAQIAADRSEPRVGAGR